MANWNLQPTYRQIKKVLNSHGEPHGAFLRHAALFNVKGQLIHVCGPHALHYFGFAQSISNLQKYFKLAPGDVIITNDPAFGSPRLCDLNFLTGIFDRQDLRGYAVVQLTHHGLLNNPKLMEAKIIDDEGFKIPPTPLDKKGEIKAALLDYLAASGVSKEEINAGFSAALTSLDRISLDYLDLETLMGRAPLAEKLLQLEKYTESVFQKSLHRFPDGEFGHQSKFAGATMHTKIKIRENGFVVDFNGTSKQDARTLQCHYALTLSACFWFFLSLLETEIPINEGCLRGFSVEAPLGSLVHPIGNYPAFLGYYKIPTMICTNLSQIVKKALPHEFENIQINPPLTFLIKNKMGVSVESLGRGQNANNLVHGASAIKSFADNTPFPSVESWGPRYDLDVKSLNLNIKREKGFPKTGGAGVNLSFSFKEEGQVRILNQGEGDFAHVLRRGLKESVATNSIHTLKAGENLLLSTANGLDWGQKEIDE